MSSTSATGARTFTVMMHVNQNEGLTIGVSQTPYIVETSRRTVLSDNAMSVLIPILEEMAGRSSHQIRDLFEERGFMVKEWERSRTDRLIIERAVA